MKKLTKTLLIAALVLGVPMGAYAFNGSHAGWNGNHSGQNNGNGNGQHNQGGQHNGNHNQGSQHNKGSHYNMTAEQTQANLQQRYDGIADPAQKAAFIKSINEYATAKATEADAMKTFAQTNQ